MQTQILDMAPMGIPKPVAESVLSFEPFVQYLREKREGVDCHRAHFFTYVINQFESRPELMGELPVTEAQRYAEQMQLVYSTLSSLAEDEATHLWSLCLPVRPVIFYSTDALFKLITDMMANACNAILPNDAEELNKEKVKYNYTFILERCYGISYNFGQDMVHALEDAQTGLQRYFRQHNDNRFIRIHYEGTLPELDTSILRPGYDDTEKVMAMLQEKLPLDRFRFEGFGITSIEEVTSQYALEQIKNMLVSHASLEEEDEYSRFYNSLKILAGNHHLEFGVLPILLVNKKVVFKEGACKNSLLVRIAQDEDEVELVYERLMDGYFKEPKLMVVDDIGPEEEKKSRYLQMLKVRGIAACGLVPVFFNQNLVGILEVYTREQKVLNKSILLKLDPAMPLLAQLFKNTIDDFHKDIDKIIKEKFTALQPSVQWKFNEVALQFLQQKNITPGITETADIVFDNVYPLYGAVDIRNSTMERNDATVADLKVQFTVLTEVLKELKQVSGFGLIDEKLFQAERWLTEIQTANPFTEQIKLNDFLENNIAPFLIELSESQPELKKIARRYFEAIDEKGGMAQENRRQLEQSMTTVISSVNNYFELLREEIQRAYPSYFEKFRTDGVEYDIYIGQSITPNRPYSDIYLKNLRLLQLTSMAAIAKYTHSLIAELPKKVETTQLIFIHSQPIDIRFRKDEKRFDVEGAYNIRYHIIKKRIDKVRIRNTQERLTQPNKIALVYFSQKEADEYIAYIRYLQGENVLENDLEKLELEELQGVSGLKALRVGVAI